MSIRPSAGYYACSMLLPTAPLMLTVTAILLLSIGGAGMIAVGVLGAITNNNYNRPASEPIWWGAVLLLLALALMLLLAPVLT